MIAVCRHLVNPRMFTTEQFIREGCGPNPFVHMPGWHVDVLVNDVLHVLDLSLIPDAAASALLELSEVAGTWEGGTQDERLRNAYVDFRNLCSQHRIRPLAEFTFLCHSMILHVCMDCMPAFCIFGLRQPGKSVFSETWRDWAYACI